MEMILIRRIRIRKLRKNLRRIIENFNSISLKSFLNKVDKK